MPRGALSVKINFVGPKAQQQKLAHGAAVLCKLRASTGEDDPLVLQRRFKEGCTGMNRGATHLIRWRDSKPRLYVQ